jgi:hypothetical protein
MKNKREFIVEETGCAVSVSALAEIFANMILAMKDEEEPAQESSCG